MLFNSYIFIVIFMPITMLIYQYSSSKSDMIKPEYILVTASIVFYGWWNWTFLFLLFFSIALNYIISRALFATTHSFRQKIILIFGVILNLCIIGYYKYWNFLISNINLILKSNLTDIDVLLPLGISFFTFQQIAYLVDIVRGKAQTISFMKYTIFVMFFPQLIAGPIVNHREIFPQIGIPTLKKISSENICIGLTLFSIGLFKKVILADGISQFSSTIFSAANAHNTLSFFEAWSGALSYTFQIYFDFSGYSDMAIGLARIFGIILPINFYSPYKAVNIIDFWKRWHISLSRFLRDYLYIPLGGNRKGSNRRYVNILITMLLGGLWHGASWNFVIWGGMHGILICVNHLWIETITNRRESIMADSNLWRLLSKYLTFLFVVFAWVLFRANDLQSAFIIYKGMLGMKGFIFPWSYETLLGAIGPFIKNLGISYGDVPYFRMRSIVWLICLFAITTLLPSSNEIFSNDRMKKIKVMVKKKSYIMEYLEWNANIKWSFFTAIIFLVSFLGLQQHSEFLYFQF